MSEHALHFVIRRGALSVGGKGTNFPLSLWVFAFLAFFFACQLSHVR